MNKSNIFNKLKKFIDLAEGMAKSHPVFVVIAFHEYFRNLYQVDPFIKKRKHEDPLKNISKVMDDCVDFLNSGKNFGSYFGRLNNKVLNKLKVRTEDLFGTLWEDRSLDKELNATKTLKGIYARSKMSTRIFKNKEVLDMGCGSGRFTAAFSKLGAKSVIGVDKGKLGLNIARIYAKKNNIKNVKYINASVLNLPFKNEKFDYIFCKGVLHHTGNLEKGLEEFNRVMKKGGAGFLYLYGSGGLFWESRTKMRKVMKKISYKDAFNILKVIGVPSKRTIFLDSWFVEIEEHVKQKSLEKWFKKKKLKFFKYKNALPYELERMEKYERFKLMYGSGELRYFVSK